MNWVTLRSPFFTWQNSMRSKRLVILVIFVTGLSTAHLSKLEAAPITSDALIENLLETPVIIRNPRDMETRGLLQGSIEKKPWSETYWPIAKGSIAARYGD